MHASLLKILSLTLLTGLLGLGSCHTVPAPPAPAETHSGPALNASELEFKGRIEAQAMAAQVAMRDLPDSDVKKAIAGPLGVISTLTAGTATQKQKDDALSPVLLQLAGKYVEAANGWAKANADADTLRNRVQSLEQQVKEERALAAAELTRQLQAARDDERRKAEESERRLIAYFFFGGGFLLVAGGVIITLYASSIPQFGPRAGLAVGSAGGVSITTGIIILQLLSHPEVIWWGLGITSVLLAIGGALLYMNHTHHTATAVPAITSTVS